MKVRKKPEVVEARQYTRNGLEAEQVAEWCGGVQTDEGLELIVGQGLDVVNYGEWIVRETDGTFTIHTPVEFQANFDEIGI